MHYRAATQKDNNDFMQQFLSSVQFYFPNPLHCQLDDARLDHGGSHSSLQARRFQGLQEGFRVETTRLFVETCGDQLQQLVNLKREKNQYCHCDCDCE